MNPCFEMKSNEWIRSLFWWRDLIRKSDLLVDLLKNDLSNNDSFNFDSIHSQNNKMRMQQKKRLPRNIFNHSDIKQLHQIQPDSNLNPHLYLNFHSPRQAKVENFGMDFGLLKKLLKFEGKHELNDIFKQEEFQVGRISKILSEIIEIKGSLVKDSLNKSLSKNEIREKLESALKSKDEIMNRTIPEIEIEMNRLNGLGIIAIERAEANLKKMVLEHNDGKMEQLARDMFEHVLDTLRVHYRHNQERTKQKIEAIKEEAVKLESLIRNQILRIGARYSLNANLLDGKMETYQITGQKLRMMIDRERAQIAAKKFHPGKPGSGIANSLLKLDCGYGIFNLDCQQFLN